MLTVIYIAPTCFDAIISPYSGSWQQYLLPYVLKKCWYELPADSKITALSRVGDMLKILNMNYRVVYMLVLHELLTENNPNSVMCIQSIHCTSKRTCICDVCRGNI